MLLLLLLEISMFFIMGVETTAGDIVCFILPLIGLLPFLNDPEVEPIETTGLRIGLAFYVN
jgi:hypothetical protein